VLFPFSDSYVNNQKLDEMHAVMQTAAAEKEEEGEVGDIIIIVRKSCKKHL
jgi:hypothetical protein